MKRKAENLKLTDCPAGLGLRSPHYPELRQRIAAGNLGVSWFEAVSENYMDSQGPPREMLRLLRAEVPIALHGVGLNLAAYTELDTSYLRQLRALVEEIEPQAVSDHLCWTGLPGDNLHDLLPFPLTHESLKHIQRRIEQFQEFIGQRLLVENVSTYMTFKEQDYSEVEFLVELCRRTGCGLLLDINNLYVNSRNQSLDPFAFLDQVPVDLVGQIHLAGYSDIGNCLYDTHSKPVWPEVWELFSHFISSAPHVPFMIERDEDIPPLAELELELDKAKRIWNHHHIVVKGGLDYEFGGISAELI